MKFKDLFVLVSICGLIPLIGYLESFMVAGTGQWYESLEKPFFTPPGWVFGPVWTILYLLMGVSFFLIWRKGLASAAGRTAAAFFILQLVFNYLWTPVFFGLKLPHIALGTIVILWLAIIATILSFYKLSRLAALLLVPYLLWVSYAAVLNASISFLNQ